ncbi:YHS domain-containing (seleno)protein [Reinekea blandensis]|uniref:YHS domain protein n=1 Tax=Reinekea blandensis MED297 TaxID=314283 RepID=A4BI63_9GAMM|nr:YHS domain-containing (seleno)protein [Reinekea blandensis]EAR08206.1 YHS domain protein [Reinekea sp. MED297] [Reinekea blandensis MED297]
MPKILISLLFLVFSASSVQALDAVYTPFLSDLAIRGYDPVAYFTQQQPVEGSADWEYEWNGATWRFSSEENRNRFMNDPEAYAPQYGGYCAWAVAQNKTASSDPEQWRIIDGKLYLNYNAKVQQDWLQQTDKFIMDADRNWPQLLGDN